MVRATFSGQYTGVSKGRLLLMLGAAGYIVSPIDLIPEAVAPVLGLADDALVLSWLATRLVEETEAFLAWEQAGMPPTPGGRRRVRCGERQRFRARLDRFDRSPAARHLLRRRATGRHRPLADRAGGRHPLTPALSPVPVRAPVAGRLSTNRRPQARSARGGVHRIRPALVR